MDSPHDELNRLVRLAGEHGWTVDDRRFFGVLWFKRDPAYVHLGVNAAGEPQSFYYGEQRRPARFWAAKRGLDGSPPDRIALVERALVKPWEEGDS